MFDGYRNGAFALGLTTGIGIALNLFLWIDYSAQKQAAQNPQPNDKSEHSEIGNWWDWLIGTFVSPRDTLAQWIMAVLTIAAVYLLLRTWQEANKTNIAAVEAGKQAAASNHIMQEANRPWIKFEFTASLHEADKVKIQIGYRKKSIGVRPAFDVTIADRIINSREFMQKSPGERTEIIAEVQRNASNWTSLSPVIFPQDHGYGLEPVEDIDPTQEMNAFLLICAARYRDRHGGEDRFTIQSAQVRIHRHKEGTEVIVHPWHISGAS